ncbi:DUF2461 domain-containing protein [Affinibrenneria salicis]|uniref:DUF2461 domain-containing protein n=1 Tax=Affinibrenneria salicis TaxID=2590031 RepID=A0A5J5FUV5_9GAMM|nr:DUF2461 domain-containing protein [Affinibrenneria salicis]KAA8996477.1 DUF2461 domain-containing protein [Affinibrenneria salicis]
MSEQFNGFSQRGLTFLQQVRQENSKEWFEAHRDVYDDALLTPFRALVASLGLSMLQIDDQFEIRPAVGKTLSRLHRDTRFSRDKSRYRSQMWLTFKRPRKGWTDAPSYFFEIGPDFWRYGLGYYSASRNTMALFRETLRDNPRSFLRVADCLVGIFTLEGESYKRPLIREQDARLASWYNRKSFAAIATSQQMETLFSARLIDVLSQGFTQLEPLYRYLMKIEAMKRVNQAPGDGEPFSLPR